MVVFLVLLVLVEATGQVMTLLYPSYDVLFLQPDKVLGWKQVPNHHWPWTGVYWYAADFSVQVETNPLGFRDIRREFSKPVGVKRVALLGDSFIEATQVPFEKTAGQVLERRLNVSPEPDLEQSKRWEVLNFGISNYGVGQYLLTWEEYARHFHPDYIAIFVAKLHMKRTVRGEEAGTFFKTKNKRLSVRPTFRLDNDTLIREPAKDCDQFVKLQEYLIRTEFGGQRVRRKEKRLITVHYAETLLKLRSHLIKSQEPITARSSKVQASNSSFLAVNLKIIEELGRQADGVGARLVVLDASQYFGDKEAVSIALREACTKNGLGYIPLYDDLLRANMNGISTRWAHDGHFNEAGNVILAEALHRWIAQDSSAGGS